MVGLKGGRLGFPPEVIIIFWNQTGVMTLEHTPEKWLSWSGFILFPILVKGSL